MLNTFLVRIEGYEKEDGDEIIRADRSVLHLLPDAHVGDSLEDQLDLLNACIEMRKSDLRLAQVEVVDIVKQLEEFSAEKAKLMKLIMARDVNHHIVQEMRKVLPSTVGDSDEMVERIMAGTLAIVEALSQQIPSGTNTSETEEKMLDSLTKIKEGKHRFFWE